MQCSNYIGVINKFTAYEDVSYIRDFTVTSVSLSPYLPMMAINELKFPILMHSFATSVKYSIIRTRFFFFKCYNEKTLTFYHQK